MRQAGEPSVEEILESIKKVIARDNRAGAVETRRQRETQGVIAEDRVAPRPRANAELARRQDEDVLDLDESAEFMMETEPAEPPLLDEGTRHSMRESLAALAMLAEPGVPPQIVRSGETSLEGLVREMLRPALAEWLDCHLPPMVERLVAAEIARIVGKKG